MTVFPNERRAKAAALLACDELNDEEIARQCGVSRRTLARWKKAPDVAAFLAACDEEWQRASWEAWRTGWQGRGSSLPIRSWEEVKAAEAAAAAAKD